MVSRPHGTPCRKGSRENVPKRFKKRGSNVDSSDTTGILATGRERTLRNVVRLFIRATFRNAREFSHADRVDLSSYHRHNLPHGISLQLTDKPIFVPEHAVNAATLMKKVRRALETN